MGNEDLTGKIKDIVSELESRINSCNQEIDSRPNMSKGTLRTIKIERATYKASLNIIYSYFPGLRKE